jgi:hypothetical protein
MIVPKGLQNYLLALVATAALVVGVTSPASAASSKVTNTKYGFTFGLPSGWQEIPLTGGDVSGILETVTKADPALKAALGDEVKRDAKQGVQSFAVGPIMHAFASNINVIVEPASGLPTGSTYFDELKSETKTELASIGMLYAASSTISTPLGKEVQATYTLPAKLAPSGGYGLQIYLRHKSLFYIVTITTASKSSNQATAAELEDSWRWISSK